MGFQASVVDSIPGDPGYTPLWKVSIVEWKTSSGTTPTILGSDDAIAAAQSKGQITITPSSYLEYRLTNKGEELVESIIGLLHWMRKWSIITT
jgi:hypothetical protein